MSPSAPLAIDYAWQHPKPAAIKAAGYVGVFRYLSLDPTKDLGPQERDALFAAGLGYVLAWETTTTRATQGFAAGASDAVTANVLAQTLGYSPKSPIFFAVDEQTSWASVVDYFRGVASKLAFPVGVYGSDAIIEGAAGSGFVPWRWQTEAWSGTIVSPFAHAYQRIKPTLTIAGTAAGTYDEDVILVLASDFPWCTSVVAPAPTPAPAPAPAPKGVPVTEAVKIPTDANGNGFLLLDGTNGKPDIPWHTFLAATPQGSDPSATVDNTYWHGSALAQDRTGKVLVSIVGSNHKNSHATVFVAVNGS